MQNDSKQLVNIKKNIHGTKYMSYFIKEDQLLGKYNKIWGKISNNIKEVYKKVFDKKTVYHGKY